MKKQLIISVTQRDIRRGKRRVCVGCPIWWSLIRRYPLAHVEVDYESVRIGTRAIPVTGKMEAWMSAFDAGQHVKPTSFFVDAAV